MSFEADAQPPADGATHGVRDRDAAELGQALQPCGDIDAVAIDRAVMLLDQFAEVDADAKAPWPFDGKLCARGLECGLDGERRADHRTGRLEDSQPGSTGHLHDPATTGLDGGAQDCARGVECRDRGVLVQRHQAGMSRGGASPARIATRR